MKKLKLRKHEFSDLIQFLKPCIAYRDEKNIALRLSKKILFDMYIKLIASFAKDHTKKEYTVSLSEIQILAFECFWQNNPYTPPFLVNFYMTLNRAIQLPNA